MSTPKNYKRRQYFISKSFQTRFIVKFCLILVLGSLLSVFLVFFTTQNTLTSSFDGGRLAIESTALSIMPSVILTNIVTTAILVVVAMILTLLISHKIAGPMYRFEQDLKEIAQGDLQKNIHIREGDQFGSVATNLNHMVQSLKSLVQEVQSDLDELSDKAAKQELPDTFVKDIEACQFKITQRFKM